MSEEIEDGNFGAFEPEPSMSETNGAGTSWLDEEESGADGLAAAEFGGAGRFELDEVRNDLLEAIEELGLGSRDPDGADSPGLWVLPVYRAHGPSRARGCRRWLALGRFGPSRREGAIG